MLVPLSWLKQYIDVELPTSELAERLSLAGLEVEAIQSIGGWWDAQRLFAGEVKSIAAHAESNLHAIVLVNCGGGIVEQTVTTAPNLVKRIGDASAAGMKVAYARAGAQVVNAQGQKIEVRGVTMKGVASTGVLCSSRELGISDEHEGVLVLSNEVAPGTPLKQILSDEVLNIAITPDAARALSVIGVAREVAAITGKDAKPPSDDDAGTGSDNTSQLADVSIEDPALCQRYIGMVIKDVTIGESPAWMKDRLSKAGVRPLNNVVDVTNFVMLEYGQPLHAFDYQSLCIRAREGEAPAEPGIARDPARQEPRPPSGMPHIIIRTAKPGEKMKTLDGTERTLDESMLMITDSAGPIAVAGVMGGADSEVSAATKDIFLESATFDRTTVRRGAQKLKMATEASYRFTRGVPSKLAEIAARRAAKLLAELAGGRVVPGTIDRYPSPQEQVEVYLTASQVRRTLGLKLSIDEISQTLRRLSFEVEHLSSASPIPKDADATLALIVEPGETVLKCIVPWFRLDVRIPADLTEEIARLHGFDSIAMTQLSEPLPRRTPNKVNEAEEKVRDILVGCGLQETINYSLTTPQKHQMLGLGDDSSATKYVSLANPMSVDRTVMRRSLVVSAVEDLAYNARFSSRLASFEIGRVYLPEQSPDGIRPLEDRRVSLLLTGPRRSTTLHPDPAGAEGMDFFDLKGVIETLLSRMGIAPGQVQFIPHRQDQTFTPRCAKVMIGDEDIGIFGELNPSALAKFDIRQDRVAVAELKLSPLIPGKWDWSRVTSVNKYPAVIEDLAFTVAESVGAGRVQETIRRSSAPNVVEIDLFDVFRGESLGAGRKSLAFRVAYQDANAALTNEQVVAIRAKIVSAVATEHGGVLRTS